MNRKLFTLLLALMVTFGVSAQSFTAKKKVANATNNVSLLQEIVDYQMSKIRVESTNYGVVVPCVKNSKATFSESFEGTFPPAGWSVINGGDPNTWVKYTTTAGHTGLAQAAISYNAAAHDDYLVTPKIAVTNGNVLKLWAKNQSTSFIEKFDVKVSTTDSLAASFTNTIASQVAPGAAWQQYEYDLSAYAGQNIYVAFYIATTDEFRLYIDDVELIQLVADDAGVASIDMASSFEADTITPKATVKNFGTAAQDFKVFLKINEGATEIYADSVDVTALAANTTLQVTFDDVIADAGNYTSKVYVVNAGDLNSSNDTLTKNHFVYTDSPVIFAQHNLATGVNSTNDSIAPIAGAGTSYGSNFKNPDYLVADNFIVPVGKIWTVKGFNFYGYQTGSTNTASTFTGAYAQIYKGDPSNGGTLVSDFSGANLLVSSMWSGVYRVATTTPDDKTRPIYKLNCQNADLVLEADTYYVVYGTNGSLASGPWAPHIATGDAKIFTASTSVWADILDGTEARGVPFDIKGTVANAPGAVVTITVNDGTNPVVGANVAIGANNFTTDASGIVTPFLGVGKNYITVSKFGFENKLDSVTVVDGVPQAKTISLTALTAFDVTFTVKNNIPANLAGATVTLKNGATTVATGTTNASGVFTATAVPVGNYTYDVTLDGYIAQTAQALVVDGAEAVNVTLLENIETPFGLDVVVTGNSAAFSWNNVQEFVDDFEAYDDFSLTFGEWTTNDVDGGNTYTIGDGSQIGFPNQGTPMAGIIFNPSATTPTALTDCDAHSGSKFVAIFDAVTASAPNNDWVISPKTIIPANGQVSYWARSGTDASYADEKLQILVSTTNTDPASFVAVSPIETTTQTWTQYTYSLSAYAGQEVYVAIHCTSNDMYFACIDDFRIGAPTKNNKAALSYNVYLDANTTPINVTGTTHTFTNVPDGDHVAHVEAVYATGVSPKASAPFNVNVGVKENAKSLVSVFPNPAKDVLKVKATSNITSIKVVNVLGAQVVNQKVDDNKAEINTANLENGIYYITIETANGVSTQKINVVK